MDGLMHTDLPKARSVFRTVLTPLLALLMVETLFLIGCLRLSGVNQQLDQNARDIMDQQVENRRGYLENFMVGTWSDLDMLAETLNTKTQQMIDNGVLSLEVLDSSSDACTPLLLEVMDDIISTLYAKRVSGIFVIFNTHGLPGVGGEEKCADKTGVHIRDLDPNSPLSPRRADLLFERAPIAVVRATNISTDAGWQPLFTFTQQENSNYDFFWHPYRAAIQADGAGDPSHYGYWGSTSYALQDSSQSAISYSIPLILPDGTVYGVLGVDLLTDYLDVSLPNAELSEDKQGSYILAVSGEGSESYTISLISGPAHQYLSPGDTLPLIHNKAGDGQMKLGGRYYYASEETFTLYNSNTPFEKERWILVGIAPEDQLYAFSFMVSGYLYVTIFYTLLAGILGSLFISRRISRPIYNLSKEVNQAQKEQGGIPQLSKTGIAEIDSFSQAFTSLSQDVVDSSTKFLRIMKMASVEIGGFELRWKDDRIFVTENFFPMFGWKEIDSTEITAKMFQSMLQEIYDTVPHTKTEQGNTLFRIQLPQGDVRYLRVEATEDSERYVGLVEDVTVATKERMRIERERDYDLLTGLCSRWAFYRKAEALFQNPDQLGHAALVMLDLDNLKHINDCFGHDWGDQYIHKAGQCFASAVPTGTLCARVSGDEFFLLFYRYDSQDHIRKILPQLVSAIQNSSFDLPNGESTKISASGGMAWYPEDSTDFLQLMRYADFAMYQVKHGQKGRLGEFNLEIYLREHDLMQRRREFREMLAKGGVSYHFQPIVDGKTGLTAAYEALMRVNLPTLNSPAEVLRMAKEEGRLKDIERLTWYKSMQSYQQLLDQGQVSEDALLFINSVASQQLSDGDRDELCWQYQNLQSRIVIELTESEDMDEAATQAKRETPGFSGMFALDDYGSGYNSEKNLLMLAPKFIKVDNSIIKKIDTDYDKQQIVSNVVHYAHERGMLIVAEGLETAQEVRKVLELGVDLLQGYFLARPGAVPPTINPTAVKLIRQYHEEHST